MCVAGRDQTWVCISFEKATAIPNIQPVEIHSSGARAHTAAGILDQSNKLDVDRFEGVYVVQTAGNLCEQTMLVPSFFLVIAGRVLAVVHDPINAPGPVLAVLSLGHRLVVAPGTRISMYTIESTIMFAQSYLDHQCLDFVHKEEASLEIKAYACWMDAALFKPL